MDMIKIYTDSIDTVWQNDETFLCVYDSRGNLIADYDFSTGLKLLLEDDKMVVFIMDDELVAGKWKFFGTKSILVDGEYLKESVSAQGNKKGKKSYAWHNKQFPWNVENSGPGQYVSREERESRLDICKACPFFDSKNVTCTLTKKNVLKATRNTDEFCPEKKWGDMDRVVGTIPLPAADIITEDDQMSFEEDLERYLEGL